MNSKDFLKEGFIEDASDVHMDHEVQMAREECYHAAEHALAIHKLLRNISEQQGLEGWVSSKITLANDYLNTVREHLEYELLQPQIDDAAIGMPIAENEQQGVAEGMEGQVVFSGSGADGSKYEIIQTGPTDFMIHANGKHIDTYSSLQRAMDVLKNEVSGLKKGVAEGLPGSLSKSDYTSGKTVKHTSSNCTACHGRKTMYKLDGKLYADNKAGATKVKCPTCKGTGDKQGVTEGAKCNQTMEGKSCPVHGLQECPGMKARALAEWKKIQRTKKLKEQGITDQEIRQRIQPTFQATDAQINDPEWMRSRGLIPMQDIERDYKDTLEKENYTDAVAKAASQGLPVFQHKGQTYATKNPDYNKYYTDKDPGHSKGGEPMALNKQQTHQLAGTNIVSGSGAPVIAGSKMLKPNPNTSGVNETTAGSVAGVVNPKSNKPKSKIGSLFGGTYQQTRKSK